MIDLEKIINKKPINSKNCIAKIDETQCIGCTKCIKSCPFDAIMGSAKLMHSVLVDECTGCGFCIEPCPVDCISMIEVSDKYLPRNPFLYNNKDLKANCENHAKTRFIAKNNRTQNNYKENNSIIDIKNILLNVTKKKNRVTIVDNELQKQIILQAKQKSFKRRERQLKYSDNNN